MEPETSVKSSKQQKIEEFDPNGAAVNNSKLFGLPFNFEESTVCILPVPWEVTVSYNTGTALGPQAILDASVQVDLYDPDLEDAWKYGIYMLDISREWLYQNNRLRPRALEILRFQETGSPIAQNNQLGWTLDDINQASEKLEKWVFEQTNNLVNHGKLVGLIGGEHSTPLGFIKCLSTQHEHFGILQIDAHADLRDTFEGFHQSHASIMYNALKLENVSKLVQVGLRDYSEGEKEMILSSNGRIKAFTDGTMKERLFEGQTWKDLCNEIVNELPEKVYISFDIDGLDPKLCPSTGTPVPGGLDMPEVNYLLRAIVNSGRKIIGFDLVEVSPGKDDWDANVGARVLYKLSNMMVKSNLME